MHKTLLLLFLIISTCTQTYGATSTPVEDSLVLLLKKSKDDTTKVNILNILSFQAYNHGEFANEMEYAKKAFTLAKKLKFEKGIAKSLISLGGAHEDIGKYEIALEKYFEALRIFEKIKNKKGASDALNSLGNAYFALTNYPDALKFHEESLEIRIQLNDLRGMAASYNNIGNIHQNSRRNEIALENHLKALKIRQEIGDYNGVATSYNNIGAVYANLGKYDSALTNYSKSLKIKEKENNQVGIAGLYLNMNYINMQLNDRADARKNLAFALEMAENIGYVDMLRECYKRLSYLDSLEGKYSNAYFSYRKFIEFRDSMFNDAITKKQVEEKMQYDFDKKEAVTKAEQEKKDALAEKEKNLSDIKLEQEKTQRYFLYGGLSLVLVFSGFLFNRFRVTQKQKRIIELKEQETKQQKHLVEEKNKEITGSITYAKRLQEAILPPQHYIDLHLPENFVFYKAKDIVAGDFYWMEIIDHVIYLAVADSTGHGVPGAMVSVVCSNALNRSVKEFGLKDTGKILDKTRELVLETFEKSDSEVKDGMDISLLTIDKNKKIIHWSGANNPLWYVSDGRLHELKADKQPIGKHEYPTPFTTHTIEWRYATTFYLFTDGFADQFGGTNGKKFMYKQLEKKLLEITDEPLKNQAALLDKIFNEWKGPLEQVDDVTILGLRL